MHTPLSKVLPHIFTLFSLFSNQFVQGKVSYDKQVWSNSEKTTFYMKKIISKQ